MRSRMYIRDEIAMLADLHNINISESDCKKISVLQSNTYGYWLEIVQFFRHCNNIVPVGNIACYAYHLV